MRQFCCTTRIGAILFFGLLVGIGSAADPPVPDDRRHLVPLRGLALLHAPEVQDELRLTAAQREDLEAFFRQVDGDWFRARNLAEAEQNAAIQRLDARTTEWGQAELTDQQQQRLRQLELQAQSVRMLLRNDLATELRLTSAQRQRFLQLAEATRAAEIAHFNSQQSQDGIATLAKQLEEAGAAEKQAFAKELTAAQHERLHQLLGPPFDTARLSRIYPLAPELLPVKQWLNSEPLTLAELRGKVVLVHFYAFQCHNCQANFEIYRRWQEKLSQRGVVQIGIQTPETGTERDRAAVAQAARENQLTFPILLDLESQNWNAWSNTMWPTVYVVDQNGYLRHWWMGELNWQGATADQQIEALIDQLLEEAQATNRPSS